MSTITQRIASAFAILFGQYGDVTKMAHDRERSRQSLYREAQQAIDAVDGTAAQARVAELEQQVAQLRSQVHDLQRRLGRAVEMTPERQAELACVAQAEGVSLPVARRILQVLLPPKARSVPSSARTRASGSVRPAAYTPITWALAPAGLVSGPSMLKTVRMPISRRAAMTCFMAVCRSGA